MPLGRAALAVTAVSVAGAVVDGCKAGSRTDRPVASTTTSQGRTVSPSGRDVAGRGTSLLRFVSALPGGGVDLESNRSPVFRNVGYRSVTPYTEVGENVTLLSLLQAGRDSVIADNRELLADGERYTIVALPDAQGSPRLRVMRDVLQPERNRARLRIVNAIPDITSVDIGLEGATEPLFRAVASGDETGFRNMEPATVTIVVRRDATSGPILRVERVLLQAGRARTIVLTRTARHRLESLSFEDEVTSGAAPPPPSSS